MCHICLLCQEICFMYGSIEILASFLVIPININLGGFFYIYNNVKCCLMSCNGVLEISRNIQIFIPVKASFFLEGIQKSGLIIEITI